MHNLQYEAQKEAAIKAAPTATEFLKLKGIIGPEGVRFIISFADFDKEDIDLALLLDEYHAIASGQKIDLDKKFESIILPTREEIIREGWRL